MLARNQDFEPQPRPRENIIIAGETKREPYAVDDLSENNLSRFVSRAGGDEKQQARDGIARPDHAQVRNNRLMPGHDALNDLISGKLRARGRPGDRSWRQRWIERHGHERERYTK